MKANQFFRFILCLSVCLLYLLVQMFQTDPLVAQVQVVCPEAGRDGSGNVGGIVNTYYTGVANATLAAGSTSINLGTRSLAGSATEVAAGDLVMIMQMQDALFNSTNTAAYGNGVGGDVTPEPPATYANGAANVSAGAPVPPATAASGFTDIRNTGRYEYAIVTGRTGVTITIRGTGTGNGLLYSYTNAAATATLARRTYQIIRVPLYGSVTLSSATPLIPPPWDGQTGGVVAIDVAGTLNITGGIVIEASGRGFRGGASRQLAGGPGINTDFRTLSTVANNGSKGEGISGTPRFVLNFFNPFSLDAQLNPVPDPTLTDTGVEGYPNGSHGRGAPGNAGGGSTDGRPSANDENSGGGGGGNGGDGGNGGRAWNSQAPTGGFGGVSLVSTINGGERLFMGGGGGGGTTNNATRSNNRPANFANITNSPNVPATAANPGIFSSGAAGGGLIIVRTGNITGTGTFRSRGATGLSTGQDGAGGGGAGGTVYVAATNTANIANITADVVGGDGGWSAFIEAHGPGGGGGGGAVISTTPGVTAPAANLAGGLSGRTGPTNNASPDGTQGGRAGTGTAINIPQVNNFGTPPSATCRANVLLVKRITALNGSTANLTGFIDDPLDANDTNPSWTPAFLRGGGTTNPTDPFVNGTLRPRPSDTLDYTIYFVNAGATRANGFRICDPIPANTTYVANAFNGLTPNDGGLPSDLGIELSIGGVTRFLTGVGDPPDRGRFFPAGIVPPNCRDTLGNPITTNTNGVVAVDINRTTGTPTFPDLPANTTTSPSTQNSGFVRFRVRIR